MTTGERGPAGDHGQAGDVGQRGPQGEKGDRGMNPLLVRHATLAYLILVLTVIVSQRNAEQNNKRLRAALMQFEREAVATDQGFCAITNRTWTEINKNRGANRKAYGLLPDSAAQLREDLLATIDGDLPHVDCSGIGNGLVDFSIQDAIRNGTLPTPTTRSNP